MSIPRILHAVWLGDRPAPMSLLNTWRAFHPDFELRLWTSAACTPCDGAPASRHFTSWGGRGFLPGIWEKHRPPAEEPDILSQVPGPWKNDAQLRALDAQPLGPHLAYSAASDIMRFEILAEYGGIYVDADTECVARLPDRMLQHEAFGGWESEQVRPGWVASCVLGARPGSPFMRALVAEAGRCDMAKHPAHELGPGIVTRVAQRHPELDVYPSRAWCPRYYQGTPARPNGDTYAVHHWGGGHDKRRDADGRWLDHGPVTPATAAPHEPGPTVSVIIPCFRQAEFLAEAVASVRAQTFTDWDMLIAVGDDAARVEANRLGAKWVEDGGKGLSHARNVAVAATRGRYVLPLDADDVLDPTYLARTVACMRGDEPAIAASHVREFGSAHGTWRLSDFANVAHANALPSCALYPRALWEAVGGYDVSIIGYEDWDFWIRCAALKPHVTQLPECLFGYRVHAGSWMRWDARNGADDFWRAMIRLRHPSVYGASQWAQDRLLLARAPKVIAARIERRLGDFPDNMACRAFHAIADGSPEWRPS